MTLLERLQLKLADAIRAAEYDLPDGFTMQIAAAADLQFGDYQSNVAMMLKKHIGANPREIASSIVEHLELEGLASADIAGPGFINFRMTSEGWKRHFGFIYKDEKLGVPEVGSVETIVVDFSAPNVAKPMHVGHIRSTIIGDSLQRIARFLGYKVITDNHIGDWGTQFGMIIYGWKNILSQEALSADPLAELLRVYQQVNALKKSDEAIANECRDELVKLQQGDEENHEIWEACVKVSIDGLNEIYDRLDVEFDHWLGESYYNDRLANTVDDLLDRGLAEESDGAICVFSGGELPQKKDPFLENRDGEWQNCPMLVRKKDGGFNYGTTDIATVDYRVREWKADKVLYVVDARQGLHFRQLFDISARRGCDIDLHHVSFGTILGKDGKPLKTRDGDLPKLMDILDDATAAAASALEEKSGHLPQEERKNLAKLIGIGAVKFTELSHNRASDYMFDLEKMVALEGDTAPYLLYSYVRASSILRNLEENVEICPERFVFSEDAEIHLARTLSRFGEVLPTVLDDYRPNLLANYLLDLAKAYHSFVAACHVLNSEGDAKMTRLALCEQAGKVMKTGLGLFGIQVPERM